LNKSEKIISSVFTIALGVLLIAMKGEMISAFMTVLGIALISLGVIEFLKKDIPRAVIIGVFGGLIIFFGWTIVTAVVYVLAAIVLIVGILAAYDCVRFRSKCFCVTEFLFSLAPSALCILIGVLLFFNELEWCFLVVGGLTILEGGLLFIMSINEK
jgi:uncharacterized membrane protein HdeD (DUF308 family)